MLQLVPTAECLLNHAGVPTKTASLQPFRFALRIHVGFVIKLY